MAKRVLITGAGGFLGSHCCHYFGSLGYKVAAVGRFATSGVDSRQYPNLWQLCGMTLPDDNLAAVFKNFEPTLVVHCAGTASVADSVDAPYLDFQRTVDVCAFTLELTRKYADKAHFVLLSSASVYGNPSTLPINEIEPCKPLSPYGFHKRLCEILCEEYEALHGLRIIVMRIFSAYGERMKRQVMFDLCRQFSDPARHEVYVRGTGLETRDFIHAIDVARAIELVAIKEACGIFNLAAGVQTSVRDLVDLIAARFGDNKIVTFDGHVRAGDPTCWQADTQKMSKMGFKPKISLSDGVSAFCDWFKESHAINK